MRTVQVVLRLGPGRFCVRTGTMPHVDGFLIEADVPGGPGAPRRARGVVRRALAGRVPARLQYDIALLVTELVANGVRHGGADDRSALRLRVDGRPPSLRVEVADPGRGRVAPRAADLDGGGGLGLHIVDRVANRWGVATGPGTRVWFEVDWL
jgi:anti-sigma regulatory factor (Ser/Thr protein kinase)